MNEGGLPPGILRPQRRSPSLLNSTLNPQTRNCHVTVALTGAAGQLRKLLPREQRDRSRVGKWGHGMALATVRRLQPRIPLPGFLCALARAVDIRWAFGLNS